MTYCYENCFQFLILESIHLIRRWDDWYHCDMSLSFSIEEKLQVGAAETSSQTGF